MRSADGSVTDLGDGRYRIRLTVGYDAAGKQVRATRTVRCPARGVPAEIERMKREYGTADAYVYGRMTVAAFIDEEYLADRQLAETTMRGYEATMRNHVRPLFSRLLMREATKLNVERALARIERPGARLNAYKLLHGAFALAFDSGYLSLNPMAKVAKPKVPAYHAEVYSIEETIEVLDVFRDSAIEPGVIIMATCGPRLSEVCALNWTDLVLDSDGGEFRIDDAYLRGVGGCITKATKTERSDRVVAIPAFAAERLKEIRGTGRIGPLMLDRNGERMAPDGFASRWRRMLLPRYSKDGRLIYSPPMRYIEAKNLRHSETTILLDEGATTRAVAARRGHVREATTREFYDRQKRAADRSTAAIMDRAARRVMGELRVLKCPNAE